MGFWWIDRVLPGLVSGALVGVAAYARLHFEKRWPYWGRSHKDHHGQDHTGTPGGAAP